MKIRNYRKTRLFGRRSSGTENENATPKRWVEMTERERIAVIEFYIQETFIGKQKDNKI